MGRYALLTTVFATIVCATTVKAQTYEYYLNQLSNHPSVAQLLERSDNYEHLSKSVLGLPDPELILGVDNIPFSDPGFNRFLPSSKVIGIRQAIPNQVIRKNKAKLQENESKVQTLTAEYQIRKLEALFIHQLIELRKVSELEDLMKKQLELYFLVEKDLRGQLEAGKAVYGRFSEIDVERSDIEQKLNSLSVERIRIQETILELVGTLPSLSPPKIQALTWVKNETLLYPTLIMYEEITLSKDKIDIAKSDFKPNYSFQALYKQRESSSAFEGDDWFSIQVSVTMPLWAQSSQTPKLKAAKAMMRSAESAYEQSLRHWNRKMASLEAEQKYALDNIALFNKKKKALKEMIAAAQRNYESGNVTLENVLDAQINHLNIAAKLVAEQSRYQTIVADFNAHIKSDKTPAGGTYADR